METHQDDEPLGAGINFADPNSRLAFLYLRTSHIAATIVLMLIFVYITCRPVWRTDVWGHLAFGERIVKNRALPTREEFSGDYADQSAEYINYQWIAQAGAYLVFDLGRHLAGATASKEARLGAGALLLTTVHALIVTLRFWMLLLVFKRLTGSMRAAVFGVILTFGWSYLSHSHLAILRPQILGELAFAVLLLPLSRPVLSRRALVLIPLLFVVWANTHGSFLMGFVLLGMFIAGRALDVMRDSRWHPLAVLGDVQVWRLTAALAISVGAVSLLNPHGPALVYKHIWKLANHPNIPALEEWKPLPLQTVPGYTVVAKVLRIDIPGDTDPPPSPVPGYWFLASIAALIPVLLLSPARIMGAQLILVLLFGWQTLVHARVFVWWLMVFPWVVVPHLYAMCRGWPLFAREKETDQLDLRKTILAVITVVVLLLWSTPADWLIYGRTPDRSRVEALTPVEAAQYLREQYRKAPGLSRCVFTSETIGDYLLWDLHDLTPTVRVFSYTHVHLQTPEHWQEYLRVKNANADWQDILDRHRVACVIVEPHLHKALVQKIRAATDRWQVVPDEQLFIARRIPAPQAP